MTNKPQIRFNRFIEPWKYCKLSDVVSYLTSGLSTKDSDGNGNYDLYDANGVIGKTNKSVIKDEYITIIKDGAGVGRTRMLPKDTSFIGTMGALMSKNSDLKYIYFLLQKADLSTKYSGSAIPHIYFKDYGEDYYFIPKIEEQEKIGKYFKELENLISLNQRKYDKLISIKKSMLEKMLPKNDSSIPEIRFKGFTKPWEQRKFLDFGEVQMCKRIFKSETSEKGDIPFFKIGTFGSEPDAYISKTLFEEYKQKYPFPKKGEILLSASGTIGRVVEYDGEDAYFQDSNIIWIKHDTSVLDIFLKVLYPSIKWDGIEGSTIKRLYNDILLNTKIMIPSIEEQNLIGNYFKELDNYIVLHQRKLEKLISIKKAFLGKMLV